MAGKSLTGDEAAHLPAGYSYLVTGRVVLNPMHPPLIKEICALPLLFLGVEMPVDAATLSRRGEDFTYQWRFGREFFARPDRDRLLFWGRVPAVLLSLGLAALIVRWASNLWGPLAGSLALFLYAFDPTITAHAQLVTTDVGFAFFATLFLYALRQYLGTPSALRLAGCGVALGLALGAKFSALSLIPLAALLIGAAAWLGAAEASENESLATARARRLWSACGAFARLLVVAYAVLWLVYLAPADPLFYLKGLRTVQRDIAGDFPFLLHGTIRPGGHPAYFLIAWLVKTPLPTLVLLGLAIASVRRARRIGRLDELFLVAPPLVLFAGYSMRAAQIGVRYLIPCFPFLFLFAARTASLSSRRVSTLLAALLAWSVVEFAAISPDHLSYFNQLAGGSRGGPRWLDDSNVDWGQGFVQLRDYLRRHPVGPYRLCHFPSNLDPKNYGIDGEPIWIDAILSPPPGTLILSAHCVARAQALLAQQYGDGPQNWLAHGVPEAIVGHAYYVYAIGPRGTDPPAAEEGAATRGQRSVNNALHSSGANSTANSPASRALL